MLKSRKISPTQRTLKALREQGAKVQVVEHWNPFAKRRIDVFHFIDILALIPGKGIVGVQCTSDSNRASHREKILTNEYAPEWLKYGGKIELTITQYGNT